MFNQSSEQRYIEPESTNLIFLSDDWDLIWSNPRDLLKDMDSLECAFAHKTCSLALRLKNGRFRFANLSEELNIALSGFWHMFFHIHRSVTFNVFTAKNYFRTICFYWKCISRSIFESPLLGVRQFLTTESLLKIVKNAFRFHV